MKKIQQHNMWQMGALAGVCLLTGWWLNPLAWPYGGGVLTALIAGLLFGILAVLSARARFVTVPLVLLIYLLCGMAAYFAYFFGVPVKYDSIVWALEANPKEVAGFISLRLIIWLTSAGILGLLTVFLAAPLRKLSLKKWALCLVGVLALALGCQKTISFLCEAGGVEREFHNTVKTNSIAPFSIFKVAHVLAGEAKLIMTLRYLPTPADKPFSAPPAEDQPIVVLVVGESARADHFSINGYPRDTSPRLAAEANLINFGTARSFDTSTRKSHIGMLTDATIANRTPQSGSLIPLYNAAGFTSITYSLQNAILVQSSVVGIVLTEATHILREMDGTDHSLLDLLRKDLTDNKAGGKFFTMFTNGSHSPYFTTYGDKFRKFTPDVFNPETMRDQLDLVRNAYDNSIFKTDDFLGGLFDILRPHNAVVLYVSDHGESLGEEGQLFHGMTSMPEHYRVPFVVWHTDSYATRYPDIVRGLREQVGKAVSHDNIYHTLIGLGGLRSAAIKTELDLTGQGGM